MIVLWLWAAAAAAVLIVCAAEREATTTALATVLAALGAWPLWAVTQLRDNCHRLVVRMLDHRIQRKGMDEVEDAQEIQQEDQALQPIQQTHVVVGEVQGQAGDYLPPANPKVQEHSQEHPRAEDAPEQGSWIGVTLLSRLINLILALAIVLGLLSLDFLRAALVTLGITAVVPLVPPAAAMGMLFAALPALFGALLLESLNITPPNAHLFSRLEDNPPAKRLFDRSVRVGIALTLVLEVCVFVDSWLLLQHEHSLLLEGLLAAISGVLVVLAGVPIFWSLILGITAVVALLLVLIWLLAAGLALVLRGVKDVTGLLAEHVVPRLVRLLALPGTALWRLVAHVPGVGALLLRDPNAERGGEDVAGSGQMVITTGANGSALPRPVSMVHRTSFVLGGESGRLVMEPLFVPFALLGGKGGVDLASYCSLKRHPERSVRTLVHRLGGRDSSPDPRALARVAEAAQTPEEADALALQLGCEEVVAQMPPKGTTDPVVVVLDGDQVLHSAAALHTLHAQLPRQPVFLLVDMSLSSPLEASARARLATLRQFQQEGLILGILLYDGRTSPLVPSVGQLRELGLMGTTLAGLLLAHKHAEQNETAVGALTQLTRETPFLTLAVGSAALVPGARLSILDPVRWATRKVPVGRGELNATRGCLQDLLHRVQTERGYRTLMVPEGATWGRSLAICMYPFRPSDDRFQEVAESLERTLGTVIPGSRSVMISGNGCWDGSGMGMDTRYFAQIGLLQGWDLPAVAGCAAPDAATEDEDGNGDLLQSSEQSTDWAREARRERSTLVPRVPPDHRPRMIPNHTHDTHETVDDISGHRPPKGANDQSNNQGDNQSIGAGPGEKPSKKSEKRRSEQTDAGLGEDGLVHIGRHRGQPRERERAALRPETTTRNVSPPSASSPSPSQSKATRPRQLKPSQELQERTKQAKQ